MLVPRMDIEQLEVATQRNALPQHEILAQSTAKSHHQVEVEPANKIPLFILQFFPVHFTTQLKFNESGEISSFVSKEYSNISS